MEGEQKYNECVIKVIASCVFDTIFILLIWLLESVFKQLNNLFLSVTSLCPRPGQKKKKNRKKGIIFFFLPLSICTVYCGPRWKLKETNFGPEIKINLLYWNLCGVIDSENKFSWKFPAFV